jgi:hypothetical protein
VDKYIRTYPQMRDLMHETVRHGAERGPLEDAVPSVRT